MFSEAMSSISSRWRESSLSIARAISGSASARGAVKKRSGWPAGWCAVAAEEVIGRRCSGFWGVGEAEGRMQSGTYHRKLRVVEDDRSKGLAVVDMHDSPTPASANEPLDGGRRRYLCLEADFDTRAVWLDMKIEDSWDEEVRRYGATERSKYVKVSHKSSA